MEHSFDIILAEKYGILEAIIIKYLQFCLIENKIKGEYFQDGRYWVRTSIIAIQKQLPYVSRNEIRRAINKLFKESIVYIGNYNQYPHDNTMWYTLSDRFVY